MTNWGATYEMRFKAVKTVSKGFRWRWLWIWHRRMTKILDLILDFIVIMLLSFLKIFFQNLRNAAFHGFWGHSIRLWDPFLAITKPEPEIEPRVEILIFKKLKV